MPLPFLLSASASPRHLWHHSTTRKISSHVLRSSHTWRVSLQRPCVGGVQQTLDKTVQLHMQPHHHTFRPYSVDEDATDSYLRLNGPKSSPDLHREQTDETAKPVRPRHFRAQTGEQRRKRQRPSRPAEVLLATPPIVHDRYQSLLSRPLKSDLSYRRARRYAPGGIHRPLAHSPIRTWSLAEQPVSLYTILARYLEHHRDSNHESSSFLLSAQERRFLHRKGFSESSVEKWATCLQEPQPSVAVRLFEPGQEIPPLFLLILFLRRKHVNMAAFGTILKHLEARKESQDMPWQSLKIISIRLVRHARQYWPEALPWIARFFTTRTTIALNAHDGPSEISPRLRSDVTQFSNVMLMLLSLPSSVNPMFGVLHQERAQFEILQLMGSTTPAIPVTRIGFRSVTQTQLAHAKTPQESEWAKLKGPSWPPWKENRTAMDEDKGYEFGTSRASKTMHRMFEAGYMPTNWEGLADIYAGWDTDQSPTIQTRTLSPGLSLWTRDQESLKTLMWAARVRATRSRREAWACFLAYEASKAPISQQVYLAMLEKLSYPEMQMTLEIQARFHLEDTIGLAGQSATTEDYPLPGETKEVFPDPASPLQQVYLTEPIPTVKEFYHRFVCKEVRPSNQLLALLMDSVPGFHSFLGLLMSSNDEGISQLLNGPHEDPKAVEAMPPYLLTAFIRALCRHGRFQRLPPENPPLLSPEKHRKQFRRDRHYLLYYAHALLLRYKPMYPPAWSAYMELVVQSSMHSELYDGTGSMDERGLVQFKIVCNLLTTMEQIELDVDEEIFGLVCIASFAATRMVKQGFSSTNDTRFVIKTGSRRLRQLFNNLTAAKYTIADTANPVHPHIPGPAVLHKYVRALGVLQDYEGLFSFSTWLTRHHEQVTQRLEAQPSGLELLQRTLVALRAALTGFLDNGNRQGAGAPEELVQLVKAQIEQRVEWGGWPEQEWVDMYIRKRNM